ncbi:MAG: hypothetical protein A3F13_00520 [Gammaproteobacteria bacterium RIFCSPHIGHO2_12_FULL_40_19]|nr:MAG: hypothetical protein A3F13_00520 [Gammaproteobacteria bacterium RIFCSPHIGHO2_12_FULL_40_19]
MRSILSRKVRNEEQVSNFINVIAHYDEATLLDKSDRLIQIIKVKGLDYVTKDEATLNAYKNRFNSLLKGFSSEFAIYCYEVRRKATQYPNGTYPQGYLHDLNARYQAKLKQTDMFVNDLYLAVISKQPEGLINKGFSVLKQLSQRFDKSLRQKYLATRHQELCAMTSKLLSAMTDYGCELLSVYEQNGMRYSAPLELLSQLINYDHVRIPFVKADVARLLPRKRLSFNHRAKTVEIHSAGGMNKYAAMLSLKGYTAKTVQGMLDELGKLPFEYTLTQSFRFYDRHDAKGRLRDQQMEMAQSKDESISQTEEIYEAFDEAASGEVGFGLHHLTIACFSDTQDALNKQVSQIVSRFSDVDITCVREDMASECTFWAQLPGNFAYTLRNATISTKNIAAFASFHNYARGKFTGNHWGEAITVLETIAGTPYYFNFHYKDVGNFLVFGAMGSGKTLSVGLLMALSTKYGGKRVIFDKDRGLEILVTASHGVYERIKPGLPTGFNPCQLEDTPENRQFLLSLFKRMLTVGDEVLTEADAETIMRTIEGIYTLPKENRQLHHVASYFGTRQPGSLRNRFDQWHGDGQHAWLFDNAVDTLNLDADMLGFDIGHILKHAECKTPALMYLVYRVQQAMAGGHGIIFFDEGWNALNDPFLLKLIEDLSRTPRKKDIIFGMATQVANDTANSAVSKAINESAFCKIFYANPSADEHVYRDCLGLSLSEYELVKTLPDHERFFLLVHGHGVNRESVVVRINFFGMYIDIDIISGNEKNLAIYDRVRAEVGHDPKIWLPRYIQAITEERSK